MYVSQHSVLVHVGAGVGNVVLATPLLLALQELGFAVDVWLAADYPQTVDLLRPWNVVRQIVNNTETQPCFSSYAHIIPAIPPFYWRHFAPYFAGTQNVVARPPQSLFYGAEQEFYLHFARVLGYPPMQHPRCMLPISPSTSFEVTSQTLVLAPGSKTGEMAALSGCGRTLPEMNSMSGT